MWPCCLISLCSFCNCHWNFLSQVVIHIGVGFVFCTSVLGIFYVRYSNIYRFFFLLCWRFVVISGTVCPRLLIKTSCSQEGEKGRLLSHYTIGQFQFNLLAPELFFLILAHSVYKKWIIQEPNKLELWNKLHFKEKKNGEYKPRLKYSVPIFVE